MKSSLLLLCFTVLCASLPAKAAPQLVSVTIADVPAGAIVIRERERALYLKIDSQRALRYRVAVPRSGMQWSGAAYIVGKHIRPAWSPPAVVKRANPGLPNLIEGGAPNNPMGAAALLLNLNEIAIHGTSRQMRGSIGTAASFGCIRMLNEDILDLYERVRIGTPVVMVR
ncbi:MAG: L,D-transpeptidase [Bdellovibrionaceae bacterium]|nr:L,D-transpeptidase [Pseudobdellovibrionaceae bacterium]